MTLQLAVKEQPSNQIQMRVFEGCVLKMKNHLDVNQFLIVEKSEFVSLSSLSSSF